MAQSYAENLFILSAPSHIRSLATVSKKKNVKICQILSKFRRTVYLYNLSIQIRKIKKLHNKHRIVVTKVGQL